jgi:NitT/TauT family transport system permease protein
LIRQRGVAAAIVSGGAPLPTRIRSRPDLVVLRISLPLITLGLLILSWTVLASHYPPYILPGPDRVGRAFLNAMGNGTLMPAVTKTVEEAGLGWAIGLGLALPLGFLVAQFRSLDWALSPHLAGAQAIPAIAIAPLLMSLPNMLGMGIKVVLAAVISFFPLMTMTITGFRQIDQNLRDVASAFGASWWQRLRYLDLPQAAPSMLAGARIGLLLAIVGAYVGELLNPDHGLGAFVFNNTQYASDTTTANAFAGVAAFFIVGAVIFSALTLVERFTLRLTQ